MIQADCLQRLKNVVRPTTIVESESLKEQLGLQVVIASETFQHTGSFKFRAAFNLAQQVPQKRLIAASSGNFGQALAYACKILRKDLIVVMPHNSAQVKIDAVRSHGAQVDLVDVSKKSRQERVNELAQEYQDALVVSAYDDLRVIEGNSTLGEELAQINYKFDSVIVPIGGGGLISGIATGFARLKREIAIYGAEPLVGNDAARSLHSGQLVALTQEPQTIADGAKTLSLGKHNWPIIQDRIKDIVEVPEEDIKQAVKMLFLHANLKVEPTGALSVAAILTRPDLFQEQSVCCVVSGGNVDPKMYCELIQ